MTALAVGTSASLAAGSPTALAAGPSAAPAVGTSASLAAGSPTAFPGHGGGIGGGHLAVPSPDVGVGDLLGGFMTRGK